MAIFFDISLKDEFENNLFSSIFLYISYFKSYKFNLSLKSIYSKRDSEELSKLFFESRKNNGIGRLS